MVSAALGDEDSDDDWAEVQMGSTSSERPQLMLMDKQAAEALESKTEKPKIKNEPEVD